ncbi:MAG: WGR domain-containing protein [Gammaproteobacteria bacterium]|nr:WGR domain-containing protein [Gammaproteobacteria bacterium]
MTDSNSHTNALQLIDDNTVNSHEKYLFVRFEKDTRYYTIILQQDLFEDWTLTLINGRIQTLLGRMRTLPYLNYDSALDAFQAHVKTRLKRGYCLETSSLVSTFRFS